MDMDREMFSVVPRGDKRSIKEIQDEEDMQENYYGVAWNWETNTYRRTGILSDLPDFEKAMKVMFVHNSVGKLPDGTFRVCNIYYRDQRTEDEVILEISDRQLVGFELSPIGVAVGLLYFIEYGVYKSYRV